MTMNELINELVKQYNYQPLPKEASIAQRELYKNALPTWCDCNGGEEILYAGSLPIAKGYSRIVIGDYGAYIEIPPSKIIFENIKIKPGEEYRTTERYKNCKYIWLCSRTNEDIKIYWQRHKVKYADYQPMMFYVSPYEVRI